VARWGGEEFLVLLRRTPISVGAEIAEKLRARLEGSPVDPVGTVTASFGATDYRDGEELSDVSSRADELLYRAKQGGRNRVSTDFVADAVVDNAAGAHSDADADSLSDEVTER
jgi:diguanylate cyclase (GGDEF)-like protein